MVHQYQAIIRHYEGHGLSEEEKGRVRAVIQERLDQLFITGVR